MEYVERVNVKKIYLALEVSSSELFDNDDITDDVEDDNQG